MTQLFDGVYKPRRTTAVEEAAEREQLVRERARVIRRKQKETDLNSKPSVLAIQREWAAGLT